MTAPLAFTVEQASRIEQNRYIMSNKPVIAGTRIPVEANKDFRSAEYSAEKIITLYPPLTPEDIAAAIAFEPRSTKTRASSSIGG
ncbi:MAG TPA: DUF433 domain-containing protein [Thermomicrobiales bacterium]|nr:DUF433 domain-containing protein [Thermomicrobiales bacterium]